MRHVPKKFSLRSVDWSVDLIDLQGENFGKCLFDRCKIVIDPNTQYTKPRREQTFYHELFHAMLDELGYHELSKDEKLVDGLGALLYEYLKTRKF